MSLEYSQEVDHLMIWELALGTVRKNFLILNITLVQKMDRMIKV